MTITETRATEIALRHGVDPQAAFAVLREAGITVVPDFAGRDLKPGDTIPTDLLHDFDLVGELQPDGQVWVAKSSAGHRKKFISQDTWYRLAEIVAQGGGQTHLYEPEP